MQTRSFNIDMVSSTKANVSDSILEAIRDGHWDFEPEPIEEERFNSTVALPGTDDKVAELAFRVRHGLPLWHSGDRKYYDESEEALK